MRTPLSFMENILGQPGGAATLDNEGKLVQREGLGGKRPATVVIGNAASGHTLNDATFLCTGTNDHVTINTAIESLPTVGGTILLMEGVYNCAGTIYITKNQVAFHGAGYSTVLLQKSAAGRMLEITGNHVTVADMILDGNKSEMGSTVHRPGIYANADNLLVERIISRNHSGSGIFINTGKYCVVTGCHSNNNDSGIFIDTCSKVQGNICLDNTTEGIVSRGAYTTISENICRGNTYGIRPFGATYGNVTGNLCVDNTSYGISVGNSSRNINIFGNQCYRNQHGLYIVNTTSNSFAASNMFRSNTSTQVTNQGTNNTIGTNKTS